MEDGKLVSIIVPVYCVEAYLAECVDSLLDQTYPHMEILLVDDASPDGCGRICDEYAAKDPRVRVIHKANGGAASARNAGLEVANGAYICLVDADDVVEKNYVQYLLENLLAHHADIAVCGFYEVTKAGRRFVDGVSPGIYSQTEYLACFLKDCSCALLWNKIYRRGVIGSLRMAEGHKIDDEFFTYQVVMDCQRVVVTDAPLYGYRMRASSVMHNDGVTAPKLIMDRIEYVRIRYRNISQRYPELDQPFLADAVDTMIRLWRCSQQSDQAKKEIRAWANAHIWKITKLKIPLRLRLAYLYHLYIKKPNPAPKQAECIEEYFA